MSAQVMVYGTLEFDDESAMDELLEQLQNDDDDVTEIGALVGTGIRRGDGSLAFAFDVVFTNGAHLAFVSWLDDALDAASSGHVDMWQEGQPRPIWFRCSAGGSEETFEGSFPHAPPRV